MGKPPKWRWIAPFVWAACVVPVAPEFEDPEPNVPPYWAASNHQPNQDVSAENPTFEVSVGDPNLADRLYVRWLIDYPPATPDTSVAEDFALPPQEGLSELRSVLSFSPGCQRHKISTSFVDHKLSLVIADRPFVDIESGRLDDVADGGHVLYIGWKFRMDCR